MKKVTNYVFTLIVVALSTGLCLAAPTPAKRAVENESDLPRHAYPMSIPASQMAVADGATFDAFAAKVMSDVNSTLAEFDIQDRATLRSLLQLKLNLLDIAGRNAEALATLQTLRDKQDKPSNKLTTGIAEEVILKARIESGEANGPKYAAAMARILPTVLNGLHWRVVGDDIKELESTLEIFTGEIRIAELKHAVDPAVAQSGAVDDAGAASIVLARRQIQVIEPTKAVLIGGFKAYIAANNVVKPDIWAAREVTLSASRTLTPVLIGIWDSGVDTALYPQQLYTDPSPDGHGAHGLGFDLAGNSSKPDLEPITDEQRDRYPEMRMLFQGANDLQNQIDSPEAAAVRKIGTTTPPAQLPSLVKEVAFYGHWMHGTHVAGIAVRGNPAARLVVFRFDDLLTEFPFAPSVAWAEKFAEDFAQIGKYCRLHHVRVVNMSWLDNIAEFEAWLAKTSSERDPDARKAQATAIYKVWRSGIEAAIQGAPGTLFVAAAGNSNSDAGFDEFVPAALRIPNLITVAAVNQAGDETSFTSYGSTVIVDADGYQVESFVPGGSRLRESGTSMASPNVANLAAKLFALDPALTPEQAIDLIKRGADATADGRRHLIDPKATVALLPIRKQGH